MNLAVRGLEGDIHEAKSFCEEVHELFGRFDFDMVDAGKVKDDCRLPVGLPGVSEQKKVGNGNYLWISYFWSYLDATGRSGFVMSSQASSAGPGRPSAKRAMAARKWLPHRGAGAGAGRGDRSERRPGPSTGLRDAEPAGYPGLRRDQGQDIRDIVEQRLAEILMRNPQRMDYYKRSQAIVADYNRQKDRTNIEGTFAKLIELGESLDAE